VKSTYKAEPNRNSPVCVIVTTFNRKETTKRFLHTLFRELADYKIAARIILVDDASTDGTIDMVTNDFPTIELLHGNGSLYWAGGVRRAIFHIGADIQNTRGIFLVNDDIVLNNNSLASILKIAEDNCAIVGGTVVTSTGAIESSGSRLGRICKPNVRLKIANGFIQRCQLLPGHLMYIPIEIFNQLSGFDDRLPYRFIDLEFTLRASRSGIPVLLAPEIVGLTDEVHSYYKETSSMRGSLPALIRKILLDPKGPHWRESAYYLRKVSPILWWLWLPLYYRAFFVAVFRSYFEKVPFVRKSATPVTLEK